MKVLIINQHIEDIIGGSQLQCEVITSHLIALGHQVIYGICYPYKEFYNLACDYALIRRPFLLNLNRALKTLRPDVILWRFNKYHLLGAALLARYYGVGFVFGMSAITDTKKWVWTARKVSADKRRRKKKRFLTARILLGAALRALKEFLNYNGFYFVGGATCLRDGLVGILPVKEQVVIYDIVPTEAKPFEWEKQYVVWVANIKAVKNPEKFIELARNFSDSDIDFLMIGGIQDSSYNYISDKSQLPCNVYYLGLKTPQEVNGIIKSCLFLVHTCDPEGFGDNFIQAWLQAKPTVSLYFEPDNMITENKIGFLSETMENLVRDTERLVKNESLRKEMGERAKTFAKEKFSPEVNMKKLEGLLLSVANMK